MASNAGPNAQRGNRWRIIGWGTAVALILTPLVAMQFTREVNWTAFDFLFAAFIIGAVGALYELAVWKMQSPSYRAGVALALAAAFLIVWATGAVGMIGSEDNPFNLLFGGVILVALAGAVIARFRSSGMALAMALAGGAHMLVSAIGMFSDLRGGIVSMTFAGLWLMSAAFFARAARAGF